MTPITFWVIPKGFTYLNLWPKDKWWFHPKQTVAELDWWPLTIIPLDFLTILRRTTSRPCLTAVLNGVSRDYSFWWFAKLWDNPLWLMVVLCGPFRLEWRSWHRRWLLTIVESFVQGILRYPLHSQLHLLWVSGNLISQTSFLKSLMNFSYEDTLVKYIPALWICCVHMSVMHNVASLVQDSSPRNQTWDKRRTRYSPVDAAHGSLAGVTWHMGIVLPEWSSPFLRSKLQEMDNIGVHQAITKMESLLAVIRSNFLKLTLLIYLRQQTVYLKPVFNGKLSHRDWI